jgi:hypothetical protein
VSDVWQAQFTLRYIENKNKKKKISKTIVHKRKIKYHENKKIKFYPL